MSLQSTFPSERPEQSREIGEAILAKNDVDQGYITGTAMNLKRLMAILQTLLFIMKLLSWFVFQQNHPCQPRVQYYYVSTCRNQ
jgi:preprotein translocase subunit SecG